MTHPHNVNSVLSLQVEVYAHTEYSVGTCEVVDTLSRDGLTCGAEVLVVLLAEVVIFGAEGKLLRIARESLLLVVSHLSVLVEVEVVAAHDAPLWENLILCSDGEDARHVARGVHSVGKHSGVVYLGVVLYVEVCGELEARSDVEFVPSVVHTDDWTDRPSSLSTL